MDKNEAQRLAAAISDLRPDWPLGSVMTFLARADMRNRAYRDTALALTAAATDPRTKTPARATEPGLKHWWTLGNVATGVSEADQTPASLPIDRLCLECFKAPSQHPWSGCPTHVTDHQPAESIYDLLDAARAAATQGARTRIDHELAAVAAKEGNA